MRQHIREILPSEDEGDWFVGQMIGGVQLRRFLPQGVVQFSGIYGNRVNYRQFDRF